MLRFDIKNLSWYGGGHTVALQKGLKASIGHVIIDEELLLICIAVSSQANNMAMPQFTDELHMPIESLGM